MSEHTPTPWEVSGNEKTNVISQGGDIYGTDGVADTYAESGAFLTDQANAAFIVRACNSHDAIVTVLEVLITAHEQLLAQSPRNMADWGDGLILRDARAALKLAREAQS